MSGVKSHIIYFCLGLLYTCSLSSEIDNEIPFGEDSLESEDNLKTKNIMRTLFDLIENFPVDKTSCGVDEEYLECGSSCEPSCDNNEEENCSYECVSGCFCKQGFVRGPFGACVLPDMCQKATMLFPWFLLSTQPRFLV
ncbi:SCO-spondin-like isoform X2 [Uloborus diversus]|uniref:SCO-spondin-like isoform X2 n=1 Tax=Uloborus diversus TaxID=327109 RepID=UPI002408F815|nr:SCO-spondin-like isoform X2 [Uloborus diversus]